MKIANIQQYNTYQHNNTNFKSWYMEVYKNELAPKTLNNLKYTTSTGMFRNNSRESDTWRRITKLIHTVYENTDKVKTSIFGCSDGREALTLRMALINDYGYDFAQKFNPINAVDVDKIAIDRANMGSLVLSGSEISIIDRYTDGGFEKYFSSPYTYNSLSGGRWNINPVLASGIKYRLGDILEEYKQIIPDKNLIFTRNLWLYLDIDDRIRLAKGLASKVGKESLIFIGDSDRLDPLRERPVDEFLLNAGFKSCKTDFVYRTPDLPYDL